MFRLRLRLACCAVFFISAVTSVVFVDAAERPNVILIFADDQGTLDLNCYGSKDLHTPNLDGLARRGVRFSQFYVGSPVCSPSRAALLTGRYPHRAGVPGNVPSHPDKQGMPTEQITIAEILKGAGYRTALFGKWHLGTVPECSPNGQGFDEFFGHKAGCIDNYSHFFYWSPPHFHDLHRNGEEIYEDGTHFSRLIVREAQRFLEENQERPFFMYLPFNIPHYPLQSFAKFRDMYDAREDLSWQRQEYAALVATLDNAVGQVLAKVDELRLRENTLVIFLSDHGHSIESRANGGGGNAGPYRGNKFTLWEGGIRVPCIASLPGRIPQDVTRDQMAVSVDWLPTICRYCDVELPRRKFDGRDITALIDSDDAESPHELYHWQSGNQWAVRSGEWKLVGTVAKGTSGRKTELFLSNMKQDTTETKNIAQDHPGITEELVAAHKEWTVEVQEQ